MPQALKRFLDIRPHEWSQFLGLTFIYFLFSIGLVWAGNAIRAEIVEVSLDFLATAQLLGGVMVVLVSIGYTAYVDRMPKNRLVIILSIMGIVGIGSVVLVLLLGPEATQPSAYLILHVFHQLLLYIWVIHWFTYIIDLYDTQAAKRIFPLISVAHPIATMIAGFSFGFLTNSLQLSHESIILIWLLLLVILLMFFITMPLLTRCRQKTEQGSTSGRLAVTRNHRYHEPLQKTTSLLASLREGFQYVAQSSFLRWMAISAFVMVGINTLVQYHASGVIEQAVAGAENPEIAFSTFTANLDGISNLIALLFQFLAFGWILRRVGLGNMNLLYPVMTLITAAGIFLYPDLLFVASVAFVNTRSFRRVARDPVFALLNNALPLHTKGQARSVINAILSPIGVIIASLFLKVVPLLPPLVLPLVILSVSVVYVFASFVLRREYTRAIVEMLQQESFSFLLSQRSEIGVTDSTTLNMLAQRLNDSPDTDFKIFMASIIGEVGGKEAIPILSQLVTESTDELRRGVAEVLVHCDVHSEETHYLYTLWLTDADIQMQQMGLMGLEQLLGQDDEEYLALAYEALQDFDREVYSQAIPALLHSDLPAYMGAADRKLRLMLNSVNPRVRMNGIQVVHQMGDVKEIPRLISLMDDSDDAVRLDATMVIDDLWQSDMPQEIYDLLLQRIDSLLDDPVESVRIAELAFLGNFPTAASADTLIQALKDSSARVRSAARDSLVEIGEQIIPHLIAITEGTDADHAKMAAIVLAQIDANRYGAKLDRYIQQLLAQIYHHYARLYALDTCRHYPSVVILENSLQTEIDRSLEEVFHFLSIWHGEEAISVIRESLASRHTRTRSNAIEALESLTSPQISRSISPLFDSEISLQTLAESAHEERDVEVFQVLLDTARGDDPWLRAVTLFALGEIGRDHPNRYRVLPELVKQDESQTELSPELTPCQAMIDLKAVVVALRFSRKNKYPEVEAAAHAALRNLRGGDVIEQAKSQEEGTVLSIVERMILLKKVRLFHNVAVDQLKVLANICEEELFKKDDIIFNEGDMGDSLYIVVSGVVNVGISSKTGGEFTQLAVYRANSAFGEMTLFDNSPRSAAAIVNEDTLTLRLRSEPLMALMVRYPDLSVELLRVLSDNLGRANNRIANLTSTMRKNF